MQGVDSTNVLPRGYGRDHAPKSHSHDPHAEEGRVLGRLFQATPGLSRERHLGGLKSIISPTPRGRA